MLGFRAVLRLRASQRAAAGTVTPQVDDVVETPLVPCNKLQAHWVKGPDGKLELRWELAQAPDAHSHAA
ncbi:MAG TPA: hypothetical protein VMZ00_12960 [Sporichthya sp.]|nr:hypothetical protein [Sporichthya sp.]